MCQIANKMYWKIKYQETINNHQVSDKQQGVLENQCTPNDRLILEKIKNRNEIKSVIQEAQEDFATTWDTISDEIGVCLDSGEIQAEIL